jgi:methylmalonyl-CoA/ethylmalonyl-CoA epimerase
MPDPARSTPSRVEGDSIPVIFDHIAVAAPRITDAVRMLTGVLGGIPDYGGLSGPYTFGQWRFDPGCIEVLEPAGHDGFLHRFLAQRGPGIHHVTFRVPSLREACNRAEAAGYEVVGVDDSDPRWAEAFLHPKQALGIVVQFAQTSGEPGDESQRWSPPPLPPSPPPPAVTVVGLRTRASSAERARVQWERIALGRCVARGAGELVFTWPPSPMRIVVEVAPEAPEGPVCVELSSDRRLTLPAGPDPALGVVFSQVREP